jgi:hypothetical protein
MSTITQLLQWQSSSSSHLAQIIQPSNTIIFAVGVILLSSSQEISRSNTSLPRSRLQIFLPNQLIMTASLLFARCYVDGDIKLILFHLQGSVRMQASISNFISGFYTHRINTSKAQNSNKQ